MFLVFTESNPNLNFKALSPLVLTLDFEFVGPDIAHHPLKLCFLFT